MLLRTLKGTGPGVFLLLIIFLVITWAQMWFINPAEYVPEPGTWAVPLNRLLQLLVTVLPFTAVILPAIFIILMMYLMVSFNTTAFFINERTFLPAFFYLALISFFPEYQKLNPVMPAAFFLIIATMRIADSYRISGIAYNFFDAALLVSLGSMFYLPLLWFGLLIFIGIAVFRTGNLIEIAVAIIGLVVPYFLAAGIFYLSDFELNVLGEEFGKSLFYELTPFQFSKPLIVVLIFTGLIFLAGLAFLLGRINTKKIRSRKIFFLLIWMFLLGAVLFLILPSASVEMIWLTAIPVSYILTHYFIFLKGKLFPEILFTLFILMVIALKVAGLLFDH